MRTDDRRRHMYAVGKTGTGKSTLLLNLVAGDIRQGRGVGLIDPHGDLVDQLLERIPRAPTNDLILFDPTADPIAFNPLQCDRPEQRPLVAAGVLSAMKKVFAIDETGAPRLLYISETFSWRLSSSRTRRYWISHACSATEHFVVRLSVACPTR